jgi:hypothetical protein
LVEEKTAKEAFKNKEVVVVVQRSGVEKREHEHARFLSPSSL